tara:strand:+ start:535 stop:864 length:330 start_codon:yes stop_codon:yes gene_type:complete
MLKFKFLISLMVFSFLLFGTSIIKNQTREIEKKIFILNKNVQLKQKDINETQLDFTYLSSPAMIEKRIEFLDSNEYMPMKSSNIFLNMDSFINLENKFASQQNKNEKEN